MNRPIRVICEALLISALLSWHEGPEAAPALGENAAARVVREAAAALRPSDPELAARLAQLAEKGAEPRPVEGSHGDERPLKALREAAAKLKASEPKLAAEIEELILRIELGE